MRLVRVVRGSLHLPVLDGFSQRSVVQKSVIDTLDAWSDDSDSDDNERVASPPAQLATGLYRLG